MTKRSERSTAFIWTVMLVLALPGVLPAPVRAQSLNDFVGTWYSETKGDGTRGGKAYDMRRELLNNRSDGTKTNTNRYYQGDRVVAEVVGTYGWGVGSGVYWTECRTILSDGKASTCSGRTEYDIISVTQRELRYKSRQTGVTYSSIRVSDDFRLP